MPVRQNTPARPPSEHTAWPVHRPAESTQPPVPPESLLPDEQPLAGPGEEPGTHPSAPATPPPHARSILMALSLALLGFVLTAVLIHLALPRPLLLHADYRTGKLQLAHEWQGRAFSAAFGSSHVHNGFDPRSFDRALAGSPLATRSLNLAVIGGSQTEQRAMALEYLHELQPPPANHPAACLVLLELTAGANFTNDHLVHPRAINIYNADTDRFVRQLVSPHMPLRQRVGRVGFAAVASLLHYVNLGMVSNWLFPPATPEPGLAEETADDRRGVLTMQATPKVRGILQHMLAQAPPHPTVTLGELLPGNTTVVHDLEAATSLHPLHVAYLNMPKLADLTEETKFPASLLVDNQQVPILNLAQPELYPQLYTLDNWLDDSHLNGQGAALASTLLAEQLRTFFAAHPTPMRCGA